MTFRLLRILLLLAFCGHTAAVAQPVQTPPPAQHILLLYAYGYGGRGVELFSEGFFQALTEAGFPVANVHAEYLDLQRNRDLPGYRADLRELLRKKYAQRRIDLIVTLQQPALDFLLAEGRDLAPRAPVITLQNRPLSDAEKTGRRIVGEINQFDIKGTLERALELFPRTQRVVFAAGSSAADRQLAEEALRVTEPWRGKLEFEATTGKTLDEILQRVTSLPPHSIVVFTQYNIDSAGHVALAYEAERLIVKAANAPVFGFYDYNLRNGGIGGSVIPVEGSGARTGQLALSILRGDTSDAEGILRVAENLPMFDWRQIERWGGDASRLPAHTVFVNRPAPIWEEHGSLLAGIALFILAESALIALLVANIRRRRAEAELQQALADTQAMNADNLKLYEQMAVARQCAETAAEETKIQAALLAETQAEALDAQRQARLAALNLMEDALAARTRAEAAYTVARENEKRFHDIVDASADWVWEVDADTRYTYVSDSVFDLLGYKPQEIIGKKPFDLMPEDEAVRVRQIFAEISALGIPFRDLDNINRHKDGSLRHVFTNGMPIHDAGGRLVGYRGLDRDATRQIEAQRQIEASEARLRLVLDATSEGVWDWDLRTGIAYLSPHYYEMTGYRPEDVTADIDFFRLTVHPDDWPGLLATMAAHQRGETASSEFDYRLATRDGDIRWMASKGRVVERDADGKALRMVGTITDISQRKAIEAALLESEAKYRLLAENSTDCIFWIGPDGRFRYVSPACANISGHAAEEFLADAELMSRIIHADDRPAYLEHLAHVDAADEEELEYRIIHSDGSLRWVSHHCKPIHDAEGAFLGRRGTNRDISQRRQAEDELRKLSLAVEQSPESIVITNLAAEIEYVNDAFLHVTGYSRDEVIGRNSRLLHSGKTPPETYTEMWRNLSAGQAWKGEFHNRRKEGSE